MMDMMIYLPADFPLIVQAVCLAGLGLWLAWLDDKYNEGWKEYDRIRKEIEGSQKKV